MKIQNSDYRRDKRGRIGLGKVKGGFNSISNLKKKRCKQGGILRLLMGVF